MKLEITCAPFYFFVYKLGSRHRRERNAQRNSHKKRHQQVDVDGMKWQKLAGRK
jgi:hypothetical protein